MFGGVGLKSLFVDYLPSILLYAAVFAISAVLVYWGLKFFSSKKKVLGVIIVIVAILIPAILAGIRYNVGSDYPAYLKMYENVVAGRPMFYRPIEPMSGLIITIAAKLHCSFLMFFGFSLITTVSLFFAFRNIFKDSKRVALAFFISLCIVFPTTLNAVRSGIAISILMLIFSLIIGKIDIKKAIISVVLFVIAFLFHKSSLIFLLLVPVIMLTKCKQSKNIFAKKMIVWSLYMLVAILFPVICILCKQYLPIGEYGKYLTGIGGSFSIPLANIMLSIPILIAGVYYLKHKESQKDSLFSNLLYVSLFYLPISVLVGWLTYISGLSRVSFILDPIIICVMVYVVTAIKKDKKLWKTIVIAGVISVTGLMFIRNLSWSRALPYKTIFQVEATSATKN